jgi:hypothetical protein
MYFTSTLLLTRLSLGRPLLEKMEKMQPKPRAVIGRGLLLQTSGRTTSCRSLETLAESNSGQISFGFSKQGGGACLVSRFLEWWLT